MHTPLIVIRSDPDRREWWKETFTQLLPDFRIVLLDEDQYDPRDVEYAVVWNPPIGMFARFPQLKCVISIGAGVSHILKDKDYPHNVPIIRTVGLPLQTRMAEYVALHVLRYHRRLSDIQSAHNQSTWTQHLTPLASEITVGVMGLGNLGSFAAKTLAGLRYQVRGWSRTGRPIEGVRVFCDMEQIEPFLSGLTILVVMLPHTPATEDILCERTFAMLPNGAYLINVGRGECVVDNDLVAALQSGKLRAATLDVFRQEPLPKDHPFWKHKEILVTCHTAAAIDPRVGGQIIADNIRAFSRGDVVNDLVDIDQGY